MNQITKAILFLFLTSAVVSCTKSDTNDLQDAQLCLNTAPASEAMNCVSKISGNTTENAYKLRCSAVFIANGFGTPSSFIDALDQINNGGNSSYSGSLSAMSTLNFGTSQSDLDEATLAFNECTSSGVGIYSQISSIFKIGTLLAKTAGSIDINNLESAAASLAGADAAVVGEVVQTTYSTACADTENASDSTKQYCAELSTALSGGATSQEIGECLLGKMADPGFVCPP